MVIISKARAKQSQLRRSQCCRPIVYPAFDKAFEAHALLRETYGWFTEGFDTADLIDAIVRDC